MLTNLHVKNFALIEEADIDFSSGLNILSGETGAGKSIILGSINIALGSKVAGEVIRRNCEYALAELTFHIEDEFKLRALEELGIEELEDGDIIISRKISANRSQIKVNGMNCTAAQVRQIAGLLIDIHGQHDNTILLNDKAHIDMIDSFGIDTIGVLKAEYKELYKEYNNILARIEELDIDDAARQREISLLEYEVDEIISAKLNVGEDEELESVFRKMNNSQKILSDISVASRLLSDGETNAVDYVNLALKAVINASTFDESLSDVIDSLSTANDILSDAARNISDYAKDCGYDESEYEDISRRLDLINSFKLKYGKSIEDINEYGIKQQDKLDELYNLTDIISGLKAESDKKKEELIQAATKLTQARKEAADKLCDAVSKALCELNFLNSEFEAHFDEMEECGANGKDSMCFMISTNVGEALKPLSKVASGGELSRIMLALKTVIADKDDTQTLIFDEIDAGISGRTAQLVGEKLKSLSKNRQIICITHLPQIAAMADVHFLIEKCVEDGATVTEIKQLDEEATIKELARLLGGSVVTEAVWNNAKELRQMSRSR